MAGPVLWAPLALSPIGIAVAQEVGTANSAAPLEEIIVTAQKREENLQKVPESILVLGSETLTQHDVESFEDYARLLPSVSFTNTSPGFSKIYMRGVSTGFDGDHSGSQPSVGVYLDEQPVTTITGPLDIYVYDIARVEALAGPQGTLYGAASEAGTIRIITNKPDTSSFKASYDVEGNVVAHGGTGYHVEGFVNIPLSSSAAVRLVGWDVHDAGFIDNVPGTVHFPLPATDGITVNNSSVVQDHFNDSDKLGGRAALKLDLNESWTISPTIMAQRQTTHGSFGYDPTVGDLEITHFFPESSKDTWYQAALSVEGHISNLDLVYTGAYLNRNVEQTSDYTDYAVAYTAYQQYWHDNAGNPINPSQLVVNNTGYSMITHELRIATPKDNPVRFIGGVFYNRQAQSIRQQYLVNDLATSLAVPGWPNTWWLTDQLRVDRDRAIFGELSYDLTSRLTVTGGLRVFDSPDSLEGFYGFGAGNSAWAPNGPGELSKDPATGLPDCNYAVPFRGAPCENIKKATTTSGVTHKLNFTYKIDDARLVYATWSRGYRPGGLNRTASLTPYQPDYLTNYEMGWKTEWLGGQVRWNGALYYDPWKSFQAPFQGQYGLSQILNAGNAVTKGIETNLSWAATASLNLSTAMSYTDAYLTTPFSLTSTSPIEAPAGQQLPNTPRLKGNVSGRYTTTVGAVEAHAQAAAVYQASSWADLRTAQREQIGQLPAFTTLDLSMGIKASNWFVDLFVKNALDKRGQLTRYLECEGCSTVYVVPTQPRTIAVKVGQSF